MSGHLCFWCRQTVHPLDTDHMLWCGDRPRFITNLIQRATP